MIAVYHCLFFKKKLSSGSSLNKDFLRANSVQPEQKRHGWPGGNILMR